jgi:SAM-dependent methyltransferase
VTDDGCPVEVYRRLPAMGEPELVHRVAGPGARILDLGAGTGRIADPLAALGHAVVAVDDSPAMLAHVRLARPHRSRIEDLDLADRFDLVLLASHLVNTPDDALRRGLLRAARRHLADGGQVLLQWHEPDWFDGLRPGLTAEGPLGGFTSRLVVHDVAGALVTATVTYADATGTWSQPFTARRLSSEEVAGELAASGLRLAAVAPAASWLLAVPA